MPLGIGLWSKRRQTKKVKSKTATRNGGRLLCQVFKQLFHALIVSVWNCIIFAAQRYASAVYAIVVCLSVCVWLSVTLRILSK